MNGNLLAQLRLPYRRESWLTVLGDLVGESLALLRAPQEIELDHANLKAILQLGHLELADGKRIALFEVAVTDQTELARNRVALRNAIARFIDQAHTHAVLVAFHQPGKKDWRLTFTARAVEIDDETFEITTRETAPKRFTFLLGPGEPCRTAAERLGELAGKAGALALADIEKAFSVERLNKEFFGQYKERYQRFVDHLVDETDAPEKIFSVTASRDSAGFEDACKPVRDFVKRLLGRVVFLHFLQRKGWLGCDPAQKDWHDGDREFLQHYFETGEEKKDAARFHSEWLTPLFFDALNNPDRPKDLFEPTGTRVPYLNGGLFEEVLPAARAIDFPAEFFRDLLEFFGQYNFTIDENDPEENEIGIDPEMLGHIFENLIEDNKDKGVFYTPKAIVQYMSQQALLHYLRTHIGEHEALDKLVLEKDPGDPTDSKSWMRQHGEQIEQLIDGCKICDPAVGSGAFPIGMLNEMLQIKLALDLTLDPHEAKKALIQNCLHGVDLDPGAIEIARLRFWLALVVDAKMPEPLPNLDYKLYCADSLIERLRGEPVNVGTKPPDNPRTRAEIQKLVEAKRRLYDAHSVPEKRKARHDLFAALGSLAQIELTHLRNETNFADVEDFGRLLKALTELNRLVGNVASIVAKREERKKGTPSTADLDHALDELQLWFEDTEKPTFLWQLHFGEIFASKPATAALDGGLNLGDTLAASERGGFDIVIENPPYVSAIDHKKTAGEEYRSLIRKWFESAGGAWDLYVPFFELSERLLNTSGNMTLICPNKYLAVPYGENLRSYLLDNAALHELTDVSREEIFVNASVYPVISHFSKGGQPPFVRSVRVRDASKGFRYSNLVVRLIDSKLLHVLPKKLWAFLLVHQADLLVKMISKSEEITRNCSIQATTTAAEADEFGVFLQENGDGWKVINTGTIDPFNCLWGRSKLTHQGDKYLRPTLRVADVSNPARRELYNSSKLVFAKMALRFEGFFDKSGEFAALNVNCIHSPTNFWSIEALSAFCHSRVFHFLYCSFFDALRMAGGYLPFQAPLLRAMRLPLAPSADKSKLSELAEGCQAAAGDTVRLQKLEAEIDQIVYRLFDLTEAEIHLIEESASR